MSQVTEQSVRFQTALASIKRSEERFSRNAETDLVCRLLLEKKKLVEHVVWLVTLDCSEHCPHNFRLPSTVQPPRVASISVLCAWAMHLALIISKHYLLTESF